MNPYFSEGVIRPYRAVETPITVAAEVLLYGLLVAIGVPLGRLVFRPRVTGREHVPHCGLVVAPTHLSGFDALAVAYALAPRTVRNMAKNELFRRPLLGRFVLGFGAFPARDGVVAASALVAAGDVVAIYPEGARRRGRERRLHTGAARTALAAGVPLVPAAIRGTDEWRRLRRWHIAFGEPIDVSDLTDLDPAAAAREATRRLGDAIKQLEAGLDS